MKIMLVKALLLLMTNSAAAAVTTNHQAFSWFIDASGNTGFVSVQRKTDPVTRIVTTTLSYSFCVETTAASCLEGTGVIPNSAFSGSFSGKFWQADVVKLLADTTMPGFVNDLCNGPTPIGGCLQGKSPATGGLISLAFVTKISYVDQLTFSEWKLENHVITIDSTDRTSQGPASVKGTLLGTNVNVSSSGAAVWGIEVLSGKGSLGANAKKAQSHLALENSMPPQALRRFLALTGRKAID